MNENMELYKKMGGKQLIEKNFECQIHISAPTLMKNTAQKTVKLISKFILTI